MGDITVAVDVGAGSVKILAAQFDGNKITTLGTIEFGDEPIKMLGSLYIDVLGIYKGIRKSIASLTCNSGGCRSLGIDTYGNGYGVLDGRGRLIGMPYHYRDDGTSGILEKMSEIMPMDELYRETGIYPVRSRVLAQLYRDVREDSPALKEGVTFLPLANLLTYFFSGEKTAEKTIASVSSLLEIGNSGWNHRLMERLSIPRRLFPPLVEGGTVSGVIDDPEIGGVGGKGTAIVHVFAHDTESALLAAPFLDDSMLFASLGTSIIFGTRTDGPIVNDEGYTFHFKNVAGAFGTNSLCKDFPGFWIVNKCIEVWKRHGEVVRQQDLNILASENAVNSTYLNVNDPVFRHDSDDMVLTIREYCRKTGQADVSAKGEIIRCLFESFALQIKWSLECLKKITGKVNYRGLVAIGGGTMNSALLQMIADALGMTVLSGSHIASSMGNVLTQLYASGELSSPDEIREVASHSCDVREFTGKQNSRWNDALESMKNLGLFHS